MKTNVAVQQYSHTKTAISPVFQNLAALLFGAIILGAVGFLSMDTAHNAAHDTRHSLAFPCH
ncbi:MAG: CbtB-domain containing protein [Hahellaceae bacterium]|nr:CbtB-domain containing protein [Hahellaceae bacterium]MCP5170153.1 CbtB-domain containing protein [Hahellaceae bacterium]